MAKKSKRRGNQNNTKKRASQAPSAGTSIGPSSTGSKAIGKVSLTKATATAEAIEMIAVAPDLTPNQPLETERDSQPDSLADGLSAPASERRTRAAGILPPPRELLGRKRGDGDDVSIPPVTPDEHPHSELEDSFFVRRATLEKAAPHHEDEEDLRHSMDPRSIQKMSAAAHARREHLTRYVKWAVMGAAAIAAIGFIRVATRGKPDIAPPPPIVHTAFVAANEGPAQHEIAGQAAQPQGAPQAGAAQPATDQGEPVAQTTTTTGADQAQAAAPTEQAAAPSQPEAPVAAAQPVAAAPATPPSTPEAVAAPVTTPAATDGTAKTALQEKKDASRLLERGNAKGAIEAGERSVALDPTDGEAWLLLGASYQQVGKNADARKAFQSCLKEGKKGPLGECKAMLQ